MEKLLTVSDVSAYLGVHTNTIYNWIHINKIPYVKVGRSVRFKIGDIENFVNDNMSTPTNK